MKPNVKKILIVVWIVLIWGQSFLSQEASAEESGQLFELLKQILPFLTHHLVRKLAHFTEYAVLGLLVRNEKDVLSSCVGFCWIIAFLDETIQIFTGRGPMIQDVWIDLFGACAGIAFLSICKWFLNRRKNKE